MHSLDEGDRSVGAVTHRPDCDPGRPRGCYGIQILIAGRRKSWRDQMSAQIRRAGFNATTVDSAVDALTVLVLGLPVNVLLTDVDLRGDLDCSRFAAAARELRPNLRIILARDLADGQADRVPDAMVLPPSAHIGGVVNTVREALLAQAA